MAAGVLDEEEFEEPLDEVPLDEVLPADEPEDESLEELPEPVVDVALVEAFESRESVR